MMCGITGGRAFGPSPAYSVDKAVLKRMNDRISHRGPDSDGFFYDDGVGLAMRRLAIIDLSPMGNQPMTTTTGKSTIIFNGEIYNYRELRELPILKGYRFRSATDTEVIMALYEKMGEECVKHLRGMFAFAIWDHEKKSLFIARDRIGKKPLIYHYDKKNGIFLFASELKALLEHPALASRTLDQDALALYLKFGYVPEPLTIFKETRKLEPAHTLTIDRDGNLRTNEYWRLDFNTKTTLSYAQAEDRIRSIIDDSVQLRMIADVPLGAFLSGGIDSSVVVAHMARHTDVPVKTFSVGFGEEKYNELQYARLVAEKYGTDHHEFMLHPDFLKDLPRIMGFYDEPFADGSAIPTWYIARETRKYVTVALNGDGGDENFAGYARYVNGMRARYVRLPPLPQSAIPRTGAARITELLGMNSHDRYYSLNAAFEQQHLLQATDKSLIHPFDPFYAEPKNLLDKWLYTDIKTFLPGDLLVKVDIATMANSLEGRSPLLDHELMEFSASLPAAWKLSGPRTKVIFKSAMKDLLPRELLTKPKQGFAVPINEWMSGELGRYAEQELLVKSPVLRRLDQDRIKRMLDLQKQGKPYGYRLWNLLMLREWEKQYAPSSETM